MKFGIPSDFNEKKHKKSKAECDHNCTINQTNLDNKIQETINLCNEFNFNLSSENDQQTIFSEIQTFKQTNLSQYTEQLQSGFNHDNINSFIEEVKDLHLHNTRSFKYSNLMSGEKGKSRENL